MKQYVLFLCFIACLPLPIMAGESEAVFAKANELYRASNYKQAITEYERLISTGVEAVEVYYNLGNSYFKSGNVPSAILNYERALRLAPGDEDVEFNLAIAQSKIVDKIDPAPQLFFISWWRYTVGLLSEHEWAVIAVVSVWLLFIALGWFFVATTSGLKKLLFTVGLSCVIVAGVTLVFAWRQYRFLHSDKAAIVFASSVSVKSAPQENAKDLFVLHEGSKVDVLETVNEWKKIRIADGSVGWMRANTMQVI
jgi:tetratricopeptide (TPR) repeat protein